jgi:hypothetical protein
MFKHSRLVWGARGSLLPTTKPPWHSTWHEGSAYQSTLSNQPYSLWIKCVDESSEKNWKRTIASGRPTNYMLYRLLKKTNNSQKYVEARSSRQWHSKSWLSWAPVFSKILSSRFYPAKDAHALDTFANFFLYPKKSCRILIYLKQWLNIPYRLLLPRSRARSNRRSGY